MKPGREIDALVAEKVMGWILKKRWPDLSLWENIEGEDRAADEATERYSVYESFRPSTYISDAWEVVEKLKDSGFHVSIKMPPKGKSDSCWVSVKDYYAEKYYTAHGVTAPFTICLAALEAVGVKVE